MTQLTGICSLDSAWVWGNYSASQTLKIVGNCILRHLDEFVPVSFATDFFNLCSLQRCLHRLPGENLWHFEFLKHKPATTVVVSPRLCRVCSAGEFYSIPSVISKSLLFVFPCMSVHSEGVQVYMESGRYRLKVRRKSEVTSKVKGNTGGINSPRRLSRKKSE